MNSIFKLSVLTKFKHPVNESQGLKGISWTELQMTFSKTKAKEGRNVQAKKMRAK